MFPTSRKDRVNYVMENPSATATSFELLIAPPGCLTVTTADESILLTSGWRQKTSIQVYTPVYSNKNSFPRRNFFVLKHNVVFTTHKCLGVTFQKIVTKTSLTDAACKLWEKEQLMVILSRMSKLGEYTFIGDQSDIDATLCTIIQKQNCWNDFIDNFSSRLTSSPNTNSTVSLNLRTTNFLSWNIVLPADETVFVYLLISTKIDSFFHR